MYICVHVFVYAFCSLICWFCSVNMVNKDECYYVMLFMRHSEIETEGGGGDDNDLVYDYDFDVQLDRTSALSRDFPRRRARFRRKAGDGGARGDYQYADELMTSLTTTRSAPPGERRGKNGTDVTSERQMSLPTDPEVI